MNILKIITFSFFVCLGVVLMHAEDSLIQRAKKGDPAAQFQVGLSYYKQGLIHNQPDYEFLLPPRKDLAQQCFSEAVTWFEKAAKKGHPKAQTFLGKCLYFGEGVRTNDQLAFKWFAEAANQGDVEAVFYIGKCYYNGDAVEKNYAEAVKFYTFAADKGMALAMNDLGVCYYQGHGVQQSYVNAAAWLEKAVAHGLNSAQDNLFVCYKGASEQGIAEFQKKLGDCYFYGVGCEIDQMNAMKLYYKAALQNYEPAQATLLNCCDTLLTEYEKDKEFILYWNDDIKDRYGNILTNKGLCFAKGWGVEQDHTEAFRLFDEASKLDNVTALYLKATCYEKGLGVEQSTPYALQIYNELKNRGVDGIEEKLKELIKPITEDNLVGIWQRKYQVQNSSANQLETISLAADGRAEIHLYMNMLNSGGQYNCNAMVQGKWHIEGNRLVINPNTNTISVKDFGTQAAYSLYRSYGFPEEVKRQLSSTISKNIIELYDGLITTPDGQYLLLSKDVEIEEISTVEPKKNTSPKKASNRKRK